MSPPVAPIIAGFLAAGFLIPSESIWAILFYALVLPTVIWHAARGRLVRPAPEFWASAALILWFTGCAFWDPGGRAGARSALWGWNGFCTLVLVLGFALGFSDARAWHDRLRTWLIGAASLNAAVSVAVFLLFHHAAPRLSGWGETRQAILGAAVLTVPVVLAGEQALKGRHRPACLAALALGVTFICLTDSRGPIAAVAVALAILIVGSRPRLLGPLLLATALAAAVIWFGFPGLAERAAAALTGRGMSYRPQIWGAALTQILHRPLLGYGPSAQLEVAREIVPAGVGLFPHDLFLSTAFYSGFIGLGLLLLLLGAAWRRAGRALEPIECWAARALIASMVVNGVTDLGQVTKGPGQLWYIIWLPLMLALTVPCQKTAAGRERAAAGAEAEPEAGELPLDPRRA